MNRVIFSYRLGNAACCQYGQYEGFKVQIDYNGNLEYAEYVIQNIEVKKEIYKLKQETVNKILNIIQQSDIENIPQNLDNGSCDGDCNEFLFYKNGQEYKITSWNIIDEEFNAEKLNNIKEEKYKKNYVNECQVTAVFHKIEKILLDEKYKLNLFRFEKIL